MKKKIDLTNIDVKHAKEVSLCALPWMHIHLTPDHNIMPCCITNTENALDVVGKQEDGIDDWMNSPAMSKMRLDMLNGIKPNACNTCYHQEQSMESFRKTTLREYGHFLPDAFEDTNEDGTLNDFKMRYLDMRFNLSKLKFKDKDLMDLWSRFTNRVQVYGSLDHFGDKAEYIRTGTKWEEVMKNYRTLLESDVTQLSITTSVSLFNYGSLTSFFDYLIDQNIAPWNEPNRGAWQINPIYGPEELSFQAMPMHMKEKFAEQHLEYFKVLKKLKKQDGSKIMFAQVEQLMRSIESLHVLANSSNKWDQIQDRFIHEVTKIDNRRGEDFKKVFPELAELLLK